MAACAKTVGNTKIVNDNASKIEDNMGDLLLEKLRGKSTHIKPWSDSIKALRIALMDKRYSMDNIERTQIQKCLDTLQKSIKVTSLQSMVERLESITRQLSLKFLAGPNGTECFISSEMFYVEVLLEANGSVKDVKIAHHGDPVSCPELSEVLSAGDFSEFTRHLEGLAAIYQLNADKKQKSKAYLALQALETDLSMLAQLQSSINEPSNFVHKSPVGILQPRKGGHPMKLTYFISPYDLLDMETKSSIPLTVETVIEKQLGHYVTVCIESSTSHKLQTQSLMSISRTSDGKSLPSFAAPSNLNSTTLPASFVLKLASPMPIAMSLVKKIQAVTCIECADMSMCQPLLSLITQHASSGELDCSNNKGLFVVLPDQHHCYFLNGSPELQGVTVASIPFTHPTHVPQILVFLRQQMLFNVLISSCIRTCSKQDLEAALMFEVTALSWLHVSVSFEHPLEESMATAEFDLTDITNVKCKLYTMSSDTSICSDEYASKVIQRCLSIPVTMRAVIRKAHGQQKKCNQSNEDLYLTMVMGNSGKFSNHPPGYSDSNSNAKFVSDFDMKLNRSGNRSSDSQSIGKLDVMSSSAYGVASPDITTSSLGLDTQGYMDSSSPAHNDLFSLTPDPRSSSHLLGSRFGLSHSPQSIGAASGKPAVPALNQNQAQLGALIGNTPAMGKPRKERSKRKAMSEGNSPRSSTGRSPKRKHSEDDIGKDLSASNMESNPAGLNLPYGMALEVTTTSSGGLDCESHVGKLASSLDNMIKYEAVPPRGSSEVLMSADHEIHRSNSNSVTSLHEILDKSNCEPSDVEPELFNNSSQGRNVNSEFQFKSEPIDFETEVMNQNPSFNNSLIESSDDFNLEQLGINTSMITAKVTPTIPIEKLKENKKVKKLKLEIPSKLEKEHNNGSEGEKQPPPVILDIISSHGKLMETTKTTSVVDLTEKRPNVEIIPIGNINSASTTLTTSTSSSMLTSGIKIVSSALNKETKLKQRDFRRGLTISERSEKKIKGEGKRDRKRKHIDSLNSSEEKPTEIFGLSITPIPSSSLPNITVEKSISLLNNKTEPTIPKSITLSVKSLNYPSGSPSTNINKTAGGSKKPQLPLGTTVSPTKSVSILKTPQSCKPKSSLKLSSSNKLHMVGVDGKSSTSGGNKIALSPLKVHNKFKSGNSGSANAKPSSHSPTVPNTNSPGKVCTKPATVKLKQLNIPNSTTLTPITKVGSSLLTSSSVSSTSLSSTSSLSSVQSATCVSASTVVNSPSTPTSTSTKPGSFPATCSNSLPPLAGNNCSISPTSSNDASNNGLNNNGVGSMAGNGENDNRNGANAAGNGSSKHNKSVIRPRKGSLNAVIDKLKATTNKPVGSESQMYHSDRKSDSKPESKEAWIDKKESHKEATNLQKMSDKAKLGGSTDQKLSEKKPEFTVKQSSQGIKLTVTKTRTEGGTKLSSSLKSGGSKSNSGSRINSSCSIQSKANVSGSATGLKPGVNSGPASKKLNTPSSAKASGVSNSAAVSGGAPQGNLHIKSASKTSLSVCPVPSTKSASAHSSPNFKQSPKHSSSESKISSGSKSQEKIGRSPIHENRPSTPKLEKSNSAGITTMPPPPVPAQPLDMVTQFRKNEEASGRQGPARQNPKHLRDSQPEESEAERKFRILLAGESPTCSSLPSAGVGTVKQSTSSASAPASSDRTEGTMSAKHDHSDKSPKHPSSDGRTTPKNLSVEKSSSLASKSNQGEMKRPSTPKLVSEGLPKNMEGILPMPPGPADMNPMKYLQTASSINKIKGKCLSSPSNDDISSPEDGLIIDYPGTPHQKSPSDRNVLKSAAATATISTESRTVMPQTKSPDKLSPASLIISRSPSQCSPIVTKSPMILGTPQSDHSNPSSVAHSSPCVIDDDLMDEALIGIGK